MSSVATGQSILWQSRKPNATTTATATTTTTATATTATSRYEHQINIKPRSLADLGLWVSQCHISRIYSYELRVLSAAVNAIATRYSRHASCLNHSPCLPAQLHSFIPPHPTSTSACHFDRVSSAFGQHVDAIFNLWRTIWTRICLNCRPLLYIHDGMSVNKSNQIKSHEFDFSLCVCVQEIVTKNKKHKCNFLSRQANKKKMKI